MELADVMRTTFSCREFTDDPVPDSVLYEIFELARFSPSGGNRQGNHVIVIRDQATKDMLGEAARPAGKLYTAQNKAGESPWNAVIPTKVTPAVAEATDVPPHLTEPAKKAPVVLVFAVDLRVVASTDKELDRIGVISGGSIYPFVWNALLAARNLGYGGTITTLAVAQEPKLKEALELPDYMAVAAIVPLGKPKKQLTKLRRRPVEDIVKMERFDGAPLKAS
jgi:nitroreductase